MSIQKPQNIDFAAYILQDAREYRGTGGIRYPVIPDLNDPGIAVHYLAEAWANQTGKAYKAELAKRARDRGLVMEVIKDHTIVALSDAREILRNEKGTAEELEETEET
ncbi:MAG: hypothetical protein ABGZ35_12845 [Planctomycetaceae bacterium]